MYLSSDAYNKIRLIMKDRWRDDAIVVLAGIDVPYNQRRARDVTRYASSHLSPHLAHSAGSLSDVAEGGNRP